MLLSVFTAYFMLLFEISHSKKLKNKKISLLCIYETDFEVDSSLLRTTRVWRFQLSFSFGRGVQFLKIMLNANVLAVL